MKEINLFIMDMSDAGNTSGVDRYISLLIKGLISYPSIHIHWIHLRIDHTLLFSYQEESELYTKITIPLPQQCNEIITESFWIQKYNEQVYRLVEHLFENKQNCIIHLNTLNLIDLAIHIRERVSCKIITHLHCIPWKSYYDTDKRKFNELYRQTYLDSSSNINHEDFITNSSEFRSYSVPDHIICLTHCAVEFLEKIMGKPNNNVSIIPNGIDDLLEDSIITKNNNDHVFNLLYVGILLESKGLDFILKAIREVKNRGYKVSLTIAGLTRPHLIRKLKTENDDLSLQFLGRIPFLELKEQYLKSNAGIIASLQEQSSYVAIEMAMFGLPIITTSVDGLDEMFIDKVNALKVKTLFSRVKGLTVDVQMMADKIITLINNAGLNNNLSIKVRQLYKNEFTLQRMIKQTVGVYNKTLEG